MKEFEDKYHLSTREFYDKFQSGQMGDDENYMI